MQQRRSDESFTLILNSIRLQDGLLDRPMLYLLTEGDLAFLQLRFMAPLVEGGESVEQRCRKWVISRYSTKSEIVQTAFTAVKAALEHELREGFLYNGRPVFSPHFDVEALVDISDANRFDVRHG